MYIYIYIYIYIYLFLCILCICTGALTDMAVSASDSGARLAADYTFSFRTSGVLPGDGKV